MPFKVISGGQTGADRAGLDWAIKHGYEIGGWCPLYRKAEDGTIPEKYPLIETLDTGYRERTYNNVRDSEATVIFCPVESPGSKLTIKACLTLRKPFLVTFNFEWDSVRGFKAWFREKRPMVLNIAGNRESVCPGIYQSVMDFLDLAKR